MSTGRKPRPRTGAGERLYQLRMRSGMTLSAASAKWGMSEHAISRYELGYEMIKSSKAVQIARTEGVSLDWLFALSDERERA